MTAEETRANMLCDIRRKATNMSDSNIYISVAKQASAEITEKKSRFICNICHVESEDEAVKFTEKIKKQHYNAKHNVYAYILNNGLKKYTDDGEPSKTAGLPILEMIEKQGITDTVCVVTRYFGGILLGTGGLVRAYTEAAKAGLEAAGTVSMKKCSLIEFNLPYSNFGSAEYIFKNFGAGIESKSFAQDISITVSVKSELAEGLTDTVKETFGSSVKITEKGQAYREI